METTPNELQLLLEQTNKAAKEWHDMADRAEIHGNTASAIYYRNQAWRIENGREYIDDIIITY